MTRRRQLPAYARALIDNRRRGFHPLLVQVLYGDDWIEPQIQARWARDLFVREGARARPYTLEWSREIGHPAIAIRPRDYAVGRYDFACVAGCSVTVVDQANGTGDYDTDAAGAVTRWGLFYELLGELADFAAIVNVRETHDPTMQPPREWALSDITAGLDASWWTPARGERLHRHAALWMEDAMAVMQRAVVAESPRGAIR